MSKKKIDDVEAEDFDFAVSKGKSDKSCGQADQGQPVQVPLPSEGAVLHGCCSNVNIALPPYDLLRLRKRLGLAAHEFHQQVRRHPDP